MQRLERSSYRVHGCGRCGGAAYFDARDEEWRCLLCSRLVSEKKPAATWPAPSTPRAA
jgi:hypothetical protein